MGTRAPPRWRFKPLNARSRGLVDGVDIVAIMCLRSYSKVKPTVLVALIRPFSGRSLRQIVGTDGHDLPCTRFEFCCPRLWLAELYRPELSCIFVQFPSLWPWRLRNFRVCFACGGTFLYKTIYLSSLWLVIDESSRKCSSVSVYCGVW